MKRVVIMNSSCNPALIKYWTHQFGKWGKYFDKVYILISEFANPEYKDYVLKILDDPKIKVIYGRDKSYLLGAEIKHIVENSEEDVFFLMDDDTVIYDNKVFEKYLPLTEKDLVIAPAHETYNHPEVIKEQCQDRYFKNIIPHSDIPTFTFIKFFLFINKKDFMKTTYDFSQSIFPKDKFEPLINLSPKHEIAGDMMRFCLELFDNGATWLTIPDSRPFNYLGGLNTGTNLRRDRDSKIGLFNSGWFHVSGMGFGLFSDLNQPNYLPDIKNYTDTDTQYQMAIRLSVVWEMLNYMDDCPEYKKFMLKRIIEIITHLKIESQFLQCQEVFHPII